MHEKAFQIQDYGAHHLLLTSPTAAQWLIGRLHNSSFHFSPLPLCFTATINSWTFNLAAATPLNPPRILAESSPPEPLPADETSCDTSAGNKAV